jgi:hypothetical protein
MGSGDPRGLQNRRAAGLPVAGAFDSHTLPPVVFEAKNYIRHLLVTSEPASLILPFTSAVWIFSF